MKKIKKRVKAKNQSCTLNNSMERPQYQPTTNFSSDFVPNAAVEPLLAEPLPLQILQHQGPTFSNPMQDLATMVFITNIPVALENYALEQILWACGPVRSFKRVTDYHAKNRKCGFCTFQNPQGMIRALRVIGGEGAIDLPELKGGVKLLPGLEGLLVLI